MSRHQERKFPLFRVFRGRDGSSGTSFDQPSLQDMLLREKVIDYLRFEGRWSHLRGVRQVMRGIEEERIVVVSVPNHTAVSPFVTPVDGGFAAGIRVDVAKYRGLTENSQRMQVGKAAESLFEEIKRTEAAGKTLMSISPDAIRSMLRA